MEITSSSGSLRILVAPLDWGLGHATRSIPIIEGLLTRGIQPVLASSGQAYQLLKKQYPQLPLWEIPAKALRYSAGSSQIGSMLRQVPHILQNIQTEKKWLNQFVQQQKIDGIISDHRLGLYHYNIPNVLLAHQIAIQPPEGFAWLSPALWQAQWRFMKRFDHIWIPDISGKHELVGKLVPARVRQMPQVTFIGKLSHLSSVKADPTYDWPAVVPLLVILSGLEPQRSLLEEKIRKEVKKSKIRTILVQGLYVKTRIQQEDNLTVVSYLKTADLAVLIQRATVVMSRSGYSSLMDYAAYQKGQIILIPTPGQTEQIYLAKRLQKQKVALYQKQDKLDLTAAFEQIRSFSGFSLHETSPVHLIDGIETFVSRITAFNS